MAKRKMQHVDAERKHVTEGLALRARRGHLNQQTVADAVGVTKSAVSEWERGVSAPGRETLAKLDRFLGNQGDVFRIYGHAPGEPTNAELLEVLRQVRDVVRLTYTVLSQLAQREGVEPPVPSTRSSDRPPVPAGRRESDRS